MVMWIAINVRGIANLLHYSDNAWSYDTNPTLVFYEAYASHYPSKQVALLMLWDKIGLQHLKHKQVFSRTLDIIGLHVNPQDMTITMPESSKTELIDTI